MRAVIVTGFDDPLVVAEADPAPLGEHDVRIDVRATGVCHSDLSARRGQYPFPLPMLLGHEGTGIVTDVGPRVTRVAIGDRVVASWVPACGRCYQCVRTRTHLCETQAAVGGIPRATWQGSGITAMSGLGTMAEMMTADESNLVAVSTSLPDEQLALIGCTVTTGVGAALWTAGVEAGATVAVIGCGGVGLSIVQGAVIAGAAEIIAVDSLRLKRDTAKQHGATVTVDPADGSVVEQIRDLTGGRGAEYTFEAVGRTATMRDAFEAACNGGIVTYVGALPASAEVAFPANALRANGKQIRGSTYGSAQILRDMPRIAALAEAGRLDLRSMVSRQLPLDGIDQAFRDMEAGSAIRSVLMPSAAL